MIASTITANLSRHLPKQLPTPPANRIENMRPTYISDELFHFVGRSAPLDHEANYLLLKHVLETRCISHAPHKVGWGTTSYTFDPAKDLLKETLIVPTVTCYCDIPFAQIGAHLVKYGSFGLSLSRHLLTKYGARPVIYVPHRGDDWEGIFTGKSHLERLRKVFLGVDYYEARVPSGALLSGEPNSPEGSLRGILMLAHSAIALEVLAFIKPFDSELDDTSPNYYYSEREWRKHGNMQFSPSEIQRIVVHASYFDRARDEMPLFQDRLHVAPEITDRGQSEST